MRTVLATLALAAILPTGRAEIDTGHSYRGRGAVLLANETIRLVVLKNGGSFPSLTLVDDIESTNPMWDSLRADREQGRPERASGAVGHFVCVDGFGQPSGAEAGRRNGGPRRSAPLGVVHRIYRAVGWSGSVAPVRNAPSRARNPAPGNPPAARRARRLRQVQPDKSSGFRPSSELGRTRDDRIPVSRARRDGGGHFFEPLAYAARAREPPSAALAHRLASGEEFKWPLAPTRAGGLVDRRAPPQESHSLDHTGHRMDPDSEWAFVTAPASRKEVAARLLVPAERVPVASDLGILSS